MAMNTTTPPGLGPVATDSTRLLNEGEWVRSDGRSTSDLTWPQWIEKLDSIRHLEDDWDGQGAEAVEPALVDAAIDWARRFEREGKASPDFAIAGVNGTIYFEWHGLTHHVEIEVTAPDRVDVCLIRKGSKLAELSTLSRPS